MSLQELMATALDPDKCEGTSNPYWFVFDPSGMAGRCMTYRDAVTQACMNIHGPFFSRESAKAYQDSHRHNLSGHEVVWCGSAHMSRDYRTLLDLAKAKTKSCPLCKGFTKELENEALRALLRAYVQDEDRYNRGEGEPFGSITTETGIAARQAIRA